MNTVHHIRFHPDDEQKIREKAEKSGMSVNAYIKSRALSSRPRKMPTHSYIIVDHTFALDEVVSEIRKAAAVPNQAQWLYQADLERIDRKLTELLRTERELVEAFNKRR